MLTTNKRSLFIIAIILVLALFFVGDTYKFTFLWVLVLPFLFLTLSVLPVVLANSFSRDLAILFLKFHRFLNKNKCIYILETIEPGKPSLWKFPLKTVALTLAIFYNFFNRSGNLQIALSDLNFYRNTIDVILVSLCIASVVNVAIFILTRAGLMFANKDDKSKINLGREMSDRFNWALSPTVILSLGYYIATKSNLAVSIPEITIFVSLCSFSAFFSLIILRKWYLEKMVNNLVSQLKKHSNL